MNRIIAVLMLSATVSVSTTVNASSNNHCKGKKVLNCHDRQIYVFSYRGNDASHTVDGMNFLADNGASKEYKCNHPNCDIKFYVKPPNTNDYSSAAAHWYYDTCVDLRVRRTSATNDQPVIEAGTSCP